MAPDQIYWDPQLDRTDVSETGKTPDHISESDLESCDFCGHTEWEAVESDHPFQLFICEDCSRGEVGVE